MQDNNHILKHPMGVEFKLPLFVPSFSSKGFAFNREDVSEATDALKLSKEFLIESLLVSSYDLYYNHIPYKEDFLTTQLTLIDSGGYEISDVYDLSATTKYNYPTKEWRLENYEEIIQKWPVHKAGLMVSFDHPKTRLPIGEQIESAKNLFKKFPGFLYDFLIKPETDSQQYIQFDSVLNHVKEFHNFSVIGVTEKELDSSILTRMVKIAKLRNELNKTNNSAPIHVFGSLDPVTSILYFLAGAEIFDGLTWLKYSYFKNMAIYPANYGALDSDLGIHVKDYSVRSKYIVNNIYYLDRLKYILLDFNATRNFELFNRLGDGYGEFFKKSFDTLNTQLK